VDQLLAEAFVGDVEVAEVPQGAQPVVHPGQGIASRGATTTLFCVTIAVEPPLDEPVARALGALLRESPAAASASGGGAWREAALREGVERPEDGPGYALSPRSTRGATRA
jgi:hypothetical protein